MLSAIRKLAHLPHYVFCSIVISFGGLLFGMDTGCIGPITTMPQFYSDFGSFSSTVHGLIVSSILIPAALASFFTGSLADKLGRPRAISIGAAIFTLGCALEAASFNLAMLFCGRIVAGVGEGLFLSIIVVYVCEIAPPRHRGVLASAQQLLTCLGICVGYFVCYGTVRVEGSSVSWRIPFALQSFLSLVYTVSTLFMLPHSPRWLEGKGRTAEANTVWDSLGVTGAEREKSSETDVRNTPLATAAENLELEAESNHQAATGQNPPLLGVSSKVHTLLRVFQKDVRKRTLLAVFMSGLQQMSGIDGVLYFSVLLFQQAGLNSSTSSFLASGVSALLMLIVTVPAFLLADRWGRRTSTITGGVVMSGCMITIGALYASSSVHSDSGAGRWIVIVLIYVFALVYCATWAISIRVHTSEMQPVSTRAPATSLAQTSNWIMNWIVAFTTPIFLAKSSFGVYFLFGGCTVLTTAIVAIASPETKGRSLEEIDAAFSNQGSSPPLQKRVTQLLRWMSRRVRSGSSDSAEGAIELHET